MAHTKVQSEGLNVEIRLSAAESGTGEKGWNSGARITKVPISNSDRGEGKGAVVVSLRQFVKPRATDERTTRLIRTFCFHIRGSSLTLILVLFRTTLPS